LSGARKEIEMARNEMTIKVALGMRTLAGAAIAGLLVAAGGAMGQQAAAVEPAGAAASGAVDREREREARPVVDVVFVLDTTGSMGGMIEGAKAKIWSIAGTIAMGEPTPIIRIGLVAYRDRGDVYVTKRTPLTEDLDAVYADLLGFTAAGGGDHPESVNQALYESVHMFEWSDNPDALKLIYLVGDAPPKIYEDDVQFSETCMVAAERGIIINTILCGNDRAARVAWTEIAKLSEGEFFQIEQSGGVAVIETPFDAEMAALDANISGTTLYFGSREELDMGERKNMAARGIVASAPASALADRAMYRLGAAGESTLVLRNDLVQQWSSGEITAENLREIEEDKLPESLRGKSLEAQIEVIEQQAAERAKIQEKLRELATKRAAFLREAQSKAPARADGFDASVVRALQKQAAIRGIVIEAPEVAPEAGEKPGDAPVEDGAAKPAVAPVRGG